MASWLDRLLGIDNRSPVPLTSARTWGAGGVLGGRHGLGEQLGLYAASSSLQAVVDQVVSAQTGITWRLYAGDGPDPTEVRRHAAVDLWNRPNPEQTGAEFIETVQLHWELTGEMWWTVARANGANDRGLPLELWPVRPDRMRPALDDNGHVAGYVYRGGGQEIPLGLREVVFSRKANPLDPHRGISPVGALLFDIHGERAAAEWNTSFFRNGAQPGGFLKLDQPVPAPELRKLLRRFRENHQGVGNAHRVGILEHQLAWVDGPSVTQRDMQFVDLRRFSQEAIRRSWRVHKAMLGDADDVNRANAEAAEDQFSKWLVVPRARRMRDTLNWKLLPLYPAGVGIRRYRFDFDDPTPPNRDQDRQDQDAAVARAEKLIGLGVDPAEAFEHEGLPAFTIVKREPEPVVEDDAIADPEAIAAAAAEWVRARAATNGHRERVPYMEGV